MSSFDKEYSWGYEIVPNLKENKWKTEDGEEEL